MDCPACNDTLSSVQLDDVTVDVCRQGCGGVWFDNYELSKVDEAHEHQGETLLTIDIEDGPKPVDHDARRSCPRCADPVTMMRHFFSVKEKVEVDRCPKCNGTWLDLGELRGIRTAFATEEERRAAASARFDQLFGEDLAKMRAESQENLDQARKIAWIFRFITPSYYIPGKQDWGAF